MNPFDKAARYAARQLDAAGFLHWVLGDLFQRWSWLGWLDTQAVPLPGEPERRCDTVAALEWRGGPAPPVAAVIEFQSRSRGDLLQRLAEYALRLHREMPAQTQPRVAYQVVGVLVNLTGPVQADVWSMAPPDFDGLGLQMRARVFTVREEDATATLQRIEQGVLSRAVLPWVPLMRGADTEALIAHWRRLAEQEPSVSRRGDYGGLARVFAELADRQEIWQRELEGFNVEVSQVVKEWQDQARAEGEARGRAEGEARGRAEGLRLVRAKLLRLLQIRFPNELPADLVAALQAVESIEILDRCFDVALTAPLAEVQNALRPQ